jgi:hypothetical protein
MSSSSDFELIHGQLHVTKDSSKPEALGRQKRSIHGSAYLQGPVQFGNDKTFHSDEVPPFTVPIPKPEATVMIGPLKNSDSPLPSVCDDNIKFIEKWEISPCGVEGVGAEKYKEKLANPYSLVVRSGSHETKDEQCGKVGIDPEITKGPAAAMFIGDVDFYGYTRIKDRLSVVEKADFNNDIVIRQDVIVGADVVAKGNITAEGDVKSNCGGHILSAKKNFDIPHPTKEGWRLTHTCVEGPEAAVYVRGRVKNTTEIALPEYWKGLVDIDTITVNLTAIGAHQDIIVKRWDDEKVYLQSRGGIPINCFYYIMAERKDTEKLIPEYQGTIEDYPGDNSQRSIAGYHYDTRGGGLTGAPKGPIVPR